MPKDEQAVVLVQDLQQSGNEEDWAAAEAGRASHRLLENIQGDSVPQAESAWLHRIGGLARKRLKGRLKVFGLQHERRRFTKRRSRALRRKGRLFERQRGPAHHSPEHSVVRPEAGPHPRRQALQFGQGRRPERPYLQGDSLSNPGSKADAGLFGPAE